MGNMEHGEHSENPMDLGPRKKYEKAMVVSTKPSPGIAGVSTFVEE